MSFFIKPSQHGYFQITIILFQCSISRTFLISAGITNWNFVPIFISALCILSTHSIFSILLLQFFNFSESKIENAINSFSFFPCFTLIE